MKSKQKKEMQAKTVQELQVALHDAKKELFDMHLEKSQGKLKNLRSISMKKDDIARIFTAIRLKEEIA